MGDSYRVFDYITDGHPVMAYVSYDILRGNSAEGGAGWPSAGHAVDADSFFGILREKTGLVFDLPTEAQWEYACRAGTTTALNSGKNLLSKNICPNMSEVGNYNIKGNEDYAIVGSYLPNAWGLYDMHGNVCEWCLDWYGDYPLEPVNDPTGPSSGAKRVDRGGTKSSSAQGCRSATRWTQEPHRWGYGSGFRIIWLP